MRPRGTSCARVARGLLMTRLLLCLAPALAACADEPVDDTVYPPGAIQIPRSRVLAVGGARIGYASSHRDGQGQDVAVLAVATAEVGARNPAWTNTALAAGGVLPAFGAIHRVVAVRPDKVVLTVDDAAGTTGLFRRADSLAVSTHGQLALPAPGATSFPIVYVELAGVAAGGQGGRPVATFETWSDQPRTAVKPADITRVELAEGELVRAHGLAHEVLAVRPADPARGLPAWVEIEPRGRP
jgi:hypothetical protein